jgi:pyruvate kinase
MSDLPGPKKRIGGLPVSPSTEARGLLHLTTRKSQATHRACRHFSTCRRVPRSGDTLYLNDGVVQQQEDEARHTGALQGGRRRVAGVAKGVNLPGIDLGASASPGRQ